MNAKKWIPWNWFKKEENGAGTTVPVRRTSSRDQGYSISSPLEQLHHEVDRWFDQAFSGFGFSPVGFNRSLLSHDNGAMLKPTLDLGATDEKYTITVEVPGVDENDVRLEIQNDTLTIQGEKKHEKEDKGKNYYRMERSYGSFQRMLSLPDDVDQDNVTASFNQGVLTVNMPRKALPKANVKQIEVRSA